MSVDRSPPAGPTPSGKHFLATELAQAKYQIADMIDEIVALRARLAELEKSKGESGAAAKP